MCVCAFKLPRFLWLTRCCHTGTEEVRDTSVCIQKLHLYQNSLCWSKSDMKNLLFKILNMKVGFNVCGFFTLNLQLFCASVSVVFTYILVLISLVREFKTKFVFVHCRCTSCLLFTRKCYVFLSLCIISIKFKLLYLTFFGLANFQMLSGNCVVLCGFSILIMNSQLFLLLLQQ